MEIRLGHHVLAYATARMMDIPQVYWSLMPDTGDLSVMWAAEKNVRAWYAADQLRAKSDPWRHIRPLPPIFKDTFPDDETRWEFRRNAEVDDRLPDRPRQGFENSWMVQESRVLPPHNLRAQQHQERVADAGKQIDLRNAVAAAEGAGEDATAAKAALAEHESWMLRRQTVHLCEDLRERLMVAEWSEDTDSVKRLREKLSLFERLAHAQQARAEALKRGDRELHQQYAGQETEIRSEISFSLLREKLSDKEREHDAAVRSGDAALQQSCQAELSKIREEMDKLMTMAE